MRAETKRQVGSAPRRVAAAGAETGEDRLLRTWTAWFEDAEGPGEAKLNGYLEDYSYFIEDPLGSWQTAIDPRWSVAARELAQTTIAHSGTPAGGFSDRSDDHEVLITRLRYVQDMATPSGDCTITTLLLKLTGFTN